MYKIMIFVLLLVPLGYAQNSDVEQLEYKLVAIEDYLKLELKDIKKQLKQKDQEINRLQKENQDFLVKIQKLEIAIKELEIQLLKIRIEPQNMAVAEVNKSIPEENAVQEKKSMFTSEKISNLADRLQSSDMNTRMAAVIKLSREQDGEAVKALMLALHDKDDYIKILTCKVLSKRNSIVACAEILKLLEDNSKDVREQANKALEEITKDTVQFYAHADKEIRSVKISEWQEKINHLKE